MTIAENIAVREAAEQALELVSESLKESLPDNAELLARAWRKLGDDIDAVTNTDRKPPEPSSIEVMTDREAKRFENHIMQFGKHKGEFLRDVPLSYLVWMDEDEFRADLRRYLKRREIWEEQDVDD